MLQYNLVEHDEYWEIPLCKKPICRFRVDSELKLDFLEPEDEETVVIIKGEFQLTVSEEEYTMDAEKPTTLGSVFSLYRKAVKSARAYKEDGRLEVEFFKGEKLYVPPDRNRNYESWEIKGVRHLQIVCMPSGGLAVWLAEPNGLEKNIH
jgi:hypothetical protein